MCRAPEIHFHLGKGQSYTVVTFCQLEGLSCKALQSQPEISACSEHGLRLSHLCQGPLRSDRYYTPAGISSPSIFLTKTQISEISAFSKIGVLELCVAAVSTV